MSSNFKPSHYPHLMPYLTVKDADKAFTFYNKAFGFTEHEPPMRENNKIVHASMRLNDCVIMFSPEGAFGAKKQAPNTANHPPAIGLYIYVPNIDDFYQKAMDNGATTLAKPEQMFWGDKMCKLQDPDGYEWTFATHTGEE